MADVKWIKVMVNIFDDEKIQLIESLPSADSIITIWFKLLCLAGKTNNDGIFLLSDKIPYTDEMLSAIFHRDITIVRMALSTFEQFGMVEIVNNVITIPNWEKHQNVDGMEKVREQTRERVSRHREKQKQLLLESNAKCNVTVTHGNATEEERRKKKEDNNIYKGAMYFPSSEKLNDAFLEFIEYRKQKKKPMGDIAITKAINLLNRLGKTDDEKIEMINNSIINGWTGIFELKTQKKESVDKSYTSNTEQQNRNATDRFLKFPPDVRARLEEEGVINGRNLRRYGLTKWQEEQLIKYGFLGSPNEKG